MFMYNADRTQVPSNYYKPQQYVWKSVKKRMFKCKIMKRNTFTNELYDIQNILV